LYYQYSDIDVFFVESENIVEIHDYTTSGGKNLIKEYISTRPMSERREIYKIRHEIILNGLLAFQELNIRQLRGKLYEIKHSDNRIMYVIKDADNVYFLHACQKQKGKAEKFEIETALKRAKELD
jgi:phage-related protein